MPEYSCHQNDGWMLFPFLGLWYTNQYRRSQDYCLFQPSFEPSSSLKFKFKHEFYYPISFILKAKSCMLFFIVEKSVAPEDILLEIWANPAPMLLRLLPPERALSLSSANPSGPFNFAIYVKRFNHQESSTFHERHFLLPRVLWASVRQRLRRRFADWVPLAEAESTLLISHFSHQTQGRTNIETFKTTFHWVEAAKTFEYDKCSQLKAHYP